MERKASTGGNWWDKLGKPQYGSEIVIRANRNIEKFDPYFSESLTSIQGVWMERLVSDDWTIDPAVWDYRLGWHPPQYKKGHLAESWEFQDPSTHIVHLRKGIHWQDIPPANGREFIADDVVFHYNRLCGLGGGFTKPSPYQAEDIDLKDLISTTATDKYTVVFKFKTPNPEFIMWTLHNFSLSRCLENPDAVKKWGDVSDWHHAIGTGPFILKDFVPNKVATLAKNPNYWGHDERHPQNRLPYVDSVKYLIIPEDNSALAAMRAGKIDVITAVSTKDAESMQKTNPEILQISTSQPAPSVDPRNDRAPFNDIRVRKAMQMAIDLPTIAKSYYRGLVEPYPAMITPRYMKEWGFPYEEWSQDLKDEYNYSPATAKKLLAEAGYPKGFKTNIVVDEASDLGLLQIVKSYFSQVGIEMEIRLMETSACTDFVLTSHKHDQLVYRTYGPLSHSAEPMSQIRRFETGSSGNYLMVNDAVTDSLYPKAMAAESVNDIDTIKKVLKDANERALRQHFTIPLLEPASYSLHQPWLKGYNAQIHSTWMGARGPSMASFYLSRFWIDQNLKKSMGH